MSRFRFLFPILLGCFFTQALRAETELTIGRVAVTAELPKEPPYVGEPIVLVIRSSLRANANLDKIIQPALADFDWQQFGTDTTTEEMVDGYWTPVLERRLTVYPRRAGRLTIPPFRRRALIRTGETWVETEFASEPLEIEARGSEGVADPNGSWLPAKAVRIGENWEPPPDKIPVGETARRTFTIEAEGVTADRLPALANLSAPGVIVIARPVARQTLVTDQGPIARAVYRWNVRPVSATPAAAPAIRIRWFDVSARVMREAVAPERQVAFLSAERGVRKALAGEGPFALFSPWPLAAFGLSFLWTASVAHVLAEGKAFRRWRGALQASPAALAELNRAAKRNDVAAFRRAVAGLARTDRDVWRRLAPRSEIAAALAALDGALFGKDGKGPPALVPLAKVLATAWRRERSARWD